MFWWILCAIGVIAIVIMVVVAVIGFIIGILDLLFSA